ncbi:zinc finger protein 513a isoform X2 [Esox lucius]|uniref:Zinc finger protein 513 n=1 Tax=Esox lucius TaxID=8010 RepID=A0AAY5JWG0_ESOLU|nr:zinc finger protein 513a isoform X2 [Esox lucius]
MPRRKQQNPQPVKYSVAAEIGFSVFPLGDEEEGSVYSRLSMESDTDDHVSRSATDPRHQEDEAPARPDREAPFPPYLSCRGCGLDLVGPYCYRCCKGGGSQFHAAFGGFRAHAGPRSRDDGEDQRLGGTDGGDDTLATGDDGPSSKLHSCQLCGFSSRYANHVKRHMKTHNGEKPYHCPLCSYASAQLVNLQRHLRIHTGEKPYKCDRCSFACSSLGNLKRHQRMHVVGQQGQGAGQEVGQEAVRHVTGAPIGPAASGPPAISQKRNREEPSASGDEAISPEPTLHMGPHNRDYLPCFSGPRLTPPPPLDHQPLLEAPGCVPGPGARAVAGSMTGTRGRAGGRAGGGAGGGAGTTSVKSEDSHIDALPPLLFPFSCRLCGVPLEDEDGSTAQICAKCTLDMLTKESSGPNSPGERGDKVYTCSACPFLTHYPNHLARHMKTHSGEKPYKCPQCDYASAHFDNLKRHHRVHTGEKPYKCHLCDYACGNLANLKRHQRVHSGAKPFQCAACSYSCNQSMNLKRHMLRHTGEKPYKCQDCGYTTGHWDNYKRHQKKHGLAADNWVKVQMPNTHEEEVDEEEEDEEGEVVGQGEKGEVGRQYMT